MQYIDAHAHIQSSAFDDDRDAVLSRMREHGVGAIVVGVDLASSKKAVALAEQHDFLWASIGLHPHDNLEEDFDEEAYRELAQNPSVVAIGECGLDYSRIGSEESRGKDGQKALFQKQISLALEARKPLMIHCRPSRGTMDAYEDMLAILDNSFLRHNPEKRGDVHFFAGNTDVAQQFLARGFSLSFTGVVTFTRDYDEVVQMVPGDRILSETDCPFVAPTPHRGKRCEPMHVIEVVKKLAELRGESEESIAQATIENTRQVFDFT